MPTDYGAIGLREYAEGQGYNVGWNPDSKQVTINGTNVKPESYNIYNKNGTYAGSQAQIQSLLESVGNTAYNANAGQSQYGTTVKQAAQKAVQPQAVQPQPKSTGTTLPTVASLANEKGMVGVREALESQGFRVGYNNETKEVTVNGTPINPAQYGFQITSDGRYMASPETMEGIINKFKDPMTFKDPYAEQKQAAISEMSAMQNWTNPYTGQQNAILNEMNNFGSFNDPYASQKNQVLSKMNAFEAYETPPEVSDYIGQLMAKSTEEFQYNPENDSSLKLAQQEVSRAIREEMGKRGMLYSDATVSLMTQEMGKLVPQYEQLSYNKWAESFNRMLNMGQTLLQWDQMQASYHMQGFDILQGQGSYLATLSDQARQQYMDSFSVLQGKGNYVNQLASQASTEHMNAFQILATKADYIQTLSNQEFEVFKNLRQQMQDEKIYALESEKFEYGKKQDAISNAYKKIDYVGFVDNETSALTGIAAGTVAGWALELMQQQEYELETLNFKYEKDIQMLVEQTAAEEHLFNVESNWRTSERKADQAYSTSERTASQGYSTSERIAEQEWRATEASKERQQEFDKMSKAFKYDTELMNYQKTLEVSSALEQQGSATSQPEFKQSDVTSLTNYYKSEYNKGGNAFSGEGGSISAKDKEVIAEILISRLHSGTINSDVAEQVRLNLGINEATLDKATKNLSSEIGLAGVAKSGKYNTSNPNTVSKIIMTGVASIGTKYVWGGNSLKNGVDCSGFTQQTFKGSGISIPRTADAQMKQATSIKYKDMQAGDLLFFNTDKDKSDADHVGIYMGNGKMIHASSSEGVKTTMITSDYWQSRYMGAGRY